MPYSILQRLISRSSFGFARAGLFAVLLASVAVVWPQQTNAREARNFPSAMDAAQALLIAAKSGDRRQVTELFGSNSETWLFSDDDTQNSESIKRFVAACEQKLEIALEGQDKATLVIGADAFPFPVPVVRNTKGWAFAADLGREELLNRRIGRNELNTIQVLLAIVDAQREYASEERDGTSSLQYARQFRSSPGKQNGLYWPTKPGEVVSPLGPLIATAALQGYSVPSTEEQVPYMGYLYQILTSQGPSAPGGAIDYVVRNRMIGGFAVLAHPANYGVTGIKSFMVNNDGIVYEADLGPNTSQVARKVRAFDPDTRWSKVD
jgi:type II secretory pathway pseudopilin PulG